MFVDGKYQVDETWYGKDGQSFKPGLLYRSAEIPSGMALYSIDFWMQTADPPRPENRIFYRDGRVVLDHTESNLEPPRRFEAKPEGLLGPMNAWPKLIKRDLYLGKDLPIGGTAHQAGTLGFVTDASLFPFIDAVNPTLTIIADALRLTAIIEKRLG